MKQHFSLPVHQLMRFSFWRGTRHEITSMWPNPSEPWSSFSTSPFLCGDGRVGFVGYMDGKFVMDAACESQTSTVKVLFNGNGWRVPATLWLLSNR
jgi:hypothetical protein